MIPLEGDELADVAKPGWVPLVILLLMFVVVVFLWRSMRKMVRTIDPSAPTKADLAQEAGDGEAAGDQPEDAATDERRPTARSSGSASPD